MKKLSILGSTGSIGTQALEVVRMHNIKIQALSANSNIDMLESQAREFMPLKVCIYREELYNDLKKRLSDTDIEVVCGMEGLCSIASMKDVDIMLNSVVGIVGLLPTLTAIECGTTIALANKETLVAGGELVTKLAEKKGVKIIPVDSEHSAIFQCLQGNDKKQLNRIFLTASGGPFYGKTRKELESVTVSDALHHPNWSMGNKITIDSATLMNKGLEFIEAMWLFGVKPSQIKILVHRESVMHSAVEYDDYSVIAQMGVPDMKIPIQYALMYPDRLPCSVRQLDLVSYGSLTFKEPDYDTFDCLLSCIEAVKIGGTMPAFINGVNEQAVKEFLSGKISFLGIGELVKSALTAYTPQQIITADDILKADKQAREYVSERL